VDRGDAPQQESPVGPTRCVLKTIDMPEQKEQEGKAAHPEAPFDLRAWLSGLGDYPPIVQAGARVLRARAQNVPSSLLATTAMRELVRLMT
jgi:hypothetical protein